MKVVKLRIDGQEFYLSPDADVAALQEQILAAASDQAAFVSFRPFGHGELSVLVTPHIPVRFEVEEHTEEQVERWAENPPSIDIGEYFSPY